MKTVRQYLNDRINQVEGYIAAERLSGNTFKLAQEQSAEAELRGMLVRLGNEIEDGAPPPAGSYDEAVRALAPYLEDGWYAQEYDGAVWFSKEKPEIKRYPLASVGGVDRFKDEWIAQGETEMLEHVKFPRCEDWRSSLRRILSGAVTEGETKLVDSENEER